MSTILNVCLSMLAVLYIKWMNFMQPCLCYVLTLLVWLRAGLMRTSQIQSYLWMGLICSGVIERSREGEGVLLYVRSELRPTVFIPDAKFPEQIWCELHANTTHSLKIGVVYRTTSKSLYNDNIDELMRTLIKEMSNQHFILMGDFNYPDIDWLQRQYTLPVSQEGKQF